MSKNSTSEHDLKCILYICTYTLLVITVRTLLKEKIFSQINHFKRFCIYKMSKANEMWFLRKPPLCPTVFLHRSVNSLERRLHCNQANIFINILHLFFNSVTSKDLSDFWLPPHGFQDPSLATISSSLRHHQLFQGPQPLLTVPISERILGSESAVWVSPSLEWMVFATISCSRVHNPS